MNTQNYSYQDVLAAAQRVDWQIDDVIGGDKQLDFSRPFLPEALARVRELTFLTADEQRSLNQIRARTYLCIFGLVEEFILPFVLDHARPMLDRDDYRTRALLRFAGEEAKHIHLFKRFREAFDAGFGQTCGVIGPAADVAKAVLGHSPLAVALTILHIEWMTQQHYLDSVKDDQLLDPTFKGLLRHHWMEEAQHAKLDTLMVEALAASANACQVDHGVQGYLDIVEFLDAGLKQQVEFDMAALEVAVGRCLNDGERTQFRSTQHQANRWTYLGSGMTHRNFARTLASIHPCNAVRVAKLAARYC